MTLLKEARTKRGLTQAALAKQACIGLRAYNYYESGQRKPDIYTAQRLADILDTTTDQLWQTK